MTISLLQSKLDHALSTKDWRLVVEVRNKMEGLMQWPKPEGPIEHPWGCQKTPNLLKTVFGMRR